MVTNPSTAAHTARSAPATRVKANDLVRAEIEFAQALPLAAFSQSAALGAFVLVDPGTNATAAAGMIQ